MSGKWVLTVGAVFIVAVIVPLIIFGIREHKKWETWCHDRGGTVSSHTDWHAVPDGRGGTTSSSNTTYYCITEDGRLLGVR